MHLPDLFKGEVPLTDQERLEYHQPVDSLLP